MGTLPDLIFVSDPQIEPGWKNVLTDQFRQPYFSVLKKFLNDEIRSGKVVYPSGPEIFNAFNATPWSQVRVVILGQDPYHGPGQAHGLCFSVPSGVRIPPSLRNIFKEIQSDLNIEISKNGDLTHWAQQGVLLLNATLTVCDGMAGSHQNKGWEQFTDAVITEISSRKQGVVFLLWGRYAMAKEILIDKQKHHILKAPHPSPLSAHSGFFGCRHFSETNRILIEAGQQPVDWRLS